MDTSEDHDCKAGPEDDCDHPQHRQDDEDAAMAAYEEAQAERYEPMIRSKLLAEGWMPPEGIAIVRNAARLEAVTTFAGMRPF